MSIFLLPSPHHCVSRADVFRRGLDDALGLVLTFLRHLFDGRQIRVVHVAQDGRLPRPDGLAEEATERFDFL